FGLKRAAIRACSGPACTAGRCRLRGLMLHLTNPKAILFFGSLYSIGVPRDASAADLLWIITAVGIQATVVFHGYALLFSNRHMIGYYLRLRRAFEAVFAVAFAAAGIKILATRAS
ncbi:LysE family transporter, partial [Bordetella petrii]|uniref:LysE family transporter n=1 Tax=Bordetella petrii TaxID=94624 RepID=UPI001E52774A